jgi:hypothetical protein
LAWAGRLRGAEVKARTARGIGVGIGRGGGGALVPDAQRVLPNFDFVTAVGARLASPSGVRSVVLLLADASDFDGLLSRAVARLVVAAREAHHNDWKHGAPANVLRAVLVKHSELHLYFNYLHQLLYMLLLHSE